MYKNINVVVDDDDDDDDDNSCSCCKSHNRGHYDFIMGKYCM